MFLRIGSDLHLEFLDHRQFSSYSIFPEDDRDSEAILILAGDIILASQVTEYWHFFETISKRFKAVIMVFGNHEFYKMHMDEAKESMYKDLRSLDNIVILDDSYVVKDQIYFYGSTLWTDFENFNPVCMSQAKMSMPENRGLVKVGKDSVPMTPEYTFDIHKESLKELDYFLHKTRVIQESSIPRVIVTHHSPSFQSTDDKYKGNILNGAFASHLDGFILDHQPDLWIHGHMHDPVDYMIGNTRIICNPRGYPMESQSNGGFNDSLFVEI